MKGTAGIFVIVMAMLLSGMAQAQISTNNQVISLTAKQAIVAFCENYDLTIVKDDATGVLQIKPREIKRHHHLQLR